MIIPHAAAAVYPDWALLNKTALISDQRNETSADCLTPEGQHVAVSFWLADPPAVSQFTVHCPGLAAASDTPPYVICAEGAFVLFCVTLVDGTIRHFVYSAAGAGACKNPSLHLLPGPDPYVAAFPTQEFGLVPCGDGEHYAVAFLDWRESHGETRQYYACVFSSETNSWTRSKAAPLRLSESDQALFDGYAHGSYKQITVGESAVGWVDLMSGILLACNLFDETPVMRFIPFPALRARITYEDGDRYNVPEYFRDVVCSGDLMRFVETDFDEPDCSKGWRATTWNTKVDWDGWRRRYTVDVDDVSVDLSYTALSPELLDEETGQLELKKLHFIFPTLSVRNDNLLYMMAKVDQRDDTAWVVSVVDMKHAVLEALVPVSSEPSDTITMYRSCAFPGYYPVDDIIDTDDGSQDGDSTQGDRYGYNDYWCDESLVSWDFSEEDPAKKEQENDDEDHVKKEDYEYDDDEEEDPVIREEECQAMKAFLCHETNTGADMGNLVDNHDKSHRICQRGFDLDDNEHLHKKKKRRKRTRSSRRKNKQAHAQVLDGKTEFLDLIRFVCCILMAIIVRASIMAFPG